MNNWKTFWEDYRKDGDDLYFQVGKTVGKKPIEARVFKKMIKDICSQLELSPEDTLLEMCCGNGLITKELCKSVKSIYAFDFTERLIKAAIKHKPPRKCKNVRYSVGDVKGSFSRQFPARMNKFLMNDSLGYFSSDDLRHILSEIETISQRQKRQYSIFPKPQPYSIYITGIPCDELKYNFYDTPARKRAYLKCKDTFNKGMGKWWPEKEIESIANEFNLNTEVSRQIGNDYRVNILLKK